MKHFVIRHTKFIFLGIVVSILLVGVWFKIASSSDKPQSLPPLLTAEALSELVGALAEDSSATGVVFSSLLGSQANVYTQVAFGQLNEHTKMPLGAQFYLADASHAMLVTLLLRLHDLQVVTLDDALAQYVPEAPHASVITLRNLANQATGLTDYLRDQAFQRQVEQAPTRLWRSDELLTWLPNQPLSFIPGNDYRYSTTNGLLLGEALARATNMSLSDALKEYLFVPLGLEDTRYSDSVLPNNVSFGYRYAHPQFAFKPGPTFIHLQNWRIEWAGPSKSVMASTHDVTRFMHLMMTSSFLSQESKRLLIGMDVSENRGWQTGLGMSQYLGGTVIRGKAHGTSIFVGYLPEYDLSFSLLANLDASRSGANPAELIGMRVLETIYGMR